MDREPSGIGCHPPFPLEAFVPVVVAYIPPARYIDSLSLYTLHSTHTNALGLLLWHYAQF